MARRGVVARSLLTTLLLSGLYIPIEQAAADASSNVTISLWEPAVGPYMNKLFAEFSKTHPGLSVSLLAYPGLGDNDSSGKLRAAVLGHNSPDLVDAAVPGSSFIQLLQPLNSYMKTIGVSANEMVPAAWSYGQWYGQQYGIADSWDPDTLLYWNKSLFKAAGLNPNVGPATWAQLTADAAKIDKISTSGKIETLGFIPWDGWTNNVVEFARLWGAPFPVVKHGSGLTVNVESPATVKALSLYGSLAIKYGLKNILDAGYGNGVNPGGSTGASGQMADPFAAGRQGMEVTGPWEIGSLKTEAPNLSYGVEAIPVPPGGQPYLVHDGWEWMIPKGAPNPQQAAELIGWLMQPAQLTQWDLGWGATPTTHAVLQETAFTKNPAFEAILAADKALGEGSWVPGLTTGKEYPDGANFVDIMDLASESVVLGKRTAEQAVTWAQQQLNAAASTNP